MSQNRSKLTKAEKVEHVARARQMQALGIEVEISEDWLRVAAEYEQRDTRVEIEQIGGTAESAIFELGLGQWGCVISAMITNQTSKAIYPVDVQLRMPWEVELFVWLTPLTVRRSSRRKRDRTYQCYRFSGKSGLEFPYKEVVNHFLTEERPLSPKRPVSGLLLATGGPLPAHVQNGQLLGATLAIVGSDHREYTQQIQLGVERLASRPKPAIRRSTLRDDPGELGVMNDGSVPPTAIVQGI